MKMERIEAAMEVPAPQGVAPLLPMPEAPDTSQGMGAAFLGVLVLAIALPYWCVRIAGELIWRDLRRIGQIAGLCGSSYLEALRRPR